MDDATQQTQTIIAMADCMDMVRSELVEAGVIDEDVPPMFLADAVLGRLGHIRAVFHNNMLRAYPDKTSAEVLAEIDKVSGSAPNSVELDLHRRIAAEKLRADLAEARATAKSRECIELRERMAARPPIPRTPEQAIGFIGSQFEVREDAEHLDNVRFQLTVHDLLSAFDWWFDVSNSAEFDGIKPPGDGAIYEAVSRRADPAGHAAADAEAMAVLGKAVTVTEKSGWTSVNDQQPPFGQLVLTYNEAASKRTDVRWGVARRERGSKFADQDWLVEAPYEWVSIGVPTHWRPLPLLPGAQAVGVDPSKAAPDLFTCIGKGGTYEMVGIGWGAGTSRDANVVLYRDVENGVIYFRTPADFNKRMAKIEAPA